MPNVIKVAGLSIPVQVAFGLNENEERIGGFSFLRAQDGTLTLMQRWVKFRVAISADGLTPDGLDGLSLGASFTLSFGAARSIFSASNAITIPAGRRSDAPFDPKAFYWHGGVRTSAPFSIAANVMTITVLATTERYEAMYWRELTMLMVERPSRTWDGSALRYRWSFTAEEV